MRNRLLFFCNLSLLVLFLTSCTSLPKSISRGDCDYNTIGRTEIDILNGISDLYSQKCFHQVIKLGQSFRETARDKYYSITAEVGELFLAEGTLSHYVLESYERSYLSFLISSSYFQLDKKDLARIELRRSVDENTSLLYNYGDDPVVLLLQAALWENLDGPNDSRFLWRRVSEHPQASEDVRRFAHNRMSLIDLGQTPRQFWVIQALDKFPKLEWKIDFSNSANSYYQISSKTQFFDECSGPEELLVSTKPWLEKLKYRHAYDYHPLLNAKSWLRLPIGILYGSTLVGTGVAVALGGCAAESRSGGCEYAVKLGGYLLSKSGDAFKATVQPDLRHWQNVPLAFYLIHSSSVTEPQKSCLSSSWNKVDLVRQVQVSEHLKSATIPEAEL